MIYDYMKARRFLRNRIEHIAETRDLICTTRFDECTISLRELCSAMVSDPEPFPQHLDESIGSICAHEYRIWLRKERTYGDAAALLIALLDATANGSRPAQGMWVTDVLRQRRDVGCGAVASGGA
ncbi:hypothetical protein ASG03_12040 [Rhizobium sp. Leaf341]|nr:hypothetical protein ASG03_12040 [Rhizobium sp. Leaf341]